MKYQTNYKTAVNWCKNSLICCNDITEIDETIYDNARFDWYNGEEPIEIYQFFLTDCTDTDVEFLEEHFGLLFTFSEKLGLYILCVDHYGTAWDYVSWTTNLGNAARELGE